MHVDQEVVYARLLNCAILDGLRGKLTRSHAEVLRMAAVEPTAHRPKPEPGCEPVMRSAKLCRGGLTYLAQPAAVVGAVQENASDFIGPRVGLIQPKAVLHSGAVIAQAEGEPRQKVVQKQV